MAGIAGAPAPKPGSLPQPVPGKETALTAESLFEDAPSADGLFADAPPVQETTAPEIPPEQFEEQKYQNPAVDFAMTNFSPSGAVEQAKNVVTRIQAGLAANDTEKMMFLKKKFGEDNAVMKNGKLYFRRAPGEKLKPLDPETLELINDILPDFSREIITELAMLPGEGAGATLGGFAGAALGHLPGAAAGVALGGVAGRILSVPFANAAADQAAEMAGVPQDPNRDKTTENLIAMGFEGTMPVVGKSIGKAVTKRIPGTVAYKAAKEAGEREIVALTKQSEEVAQAAHELNQMGRGATFNPATVGMPGARVSLMGHQLSPDSPQLLASAARSKANPLYIKAENELAEGWGDSVRNTLTEIARKNNPGPLRPEMLASKVTNAVNDLRAAEGKAIGQFKSKAMQNLKNERQPLPPDMRGRVEELLREFNFSPRTKQSETRTKYFNGLLDRKTKTETTVWNPPKDLSAVQGRLQLNDAGDVRAAVNALNEVAKGLDTGLRPSDIERLRGVLGGLSDSFYDKQAGQRFGQLSGDMRGLYKETIKKGLDDDFEKAAFESAMSEFSEMAGNVQTLKKVLNDDYSAKAIVRSFFTGKENLAKIKAIKQLSPESFSSLREHFVNELMIDYADRSAKTGLNSTGFLNALDKKYGKEFLNEVFEGGKGADLDTLRKGLLVTERIESMTKKTSPELMSESQKKAAVDAASGWLLGIKSRMATGFVNLLTLGGKKDSALMDILTRDGIDKYVAQYPGRTADKKKLHEQFYNMLAEYKLMKAARSAAESAAPVAGRATKATVRQSLQETE